jgi:hypothetical protein
LIDRLLPPLLADCLVGWGWPPLLYPASAGSKPTFRKKKAKKKEKVFGSNQ